MVLTEDTRSSRSTVCPSATLSTTNSTWAAVGSNVGLCNDRRATNCLNHGMVLIPSRCHARSLFLYGLFNDTVSVRCRWQRVCVCVCVCVCARARRERERERKRERERRDLVLI